MALFGTKRIHELELENLNLLREKTDLYIEMTKRDTQHFKRVTELEEELIDKLELSDLQLSKLRFIFSIERARAIGVPEEQFLHTHEEITKYFTSEES